MVTGPGGFLDTTKILQEVSLTDGMHVGDFGSGSGYFTIEAARAVGESGRVYAVDVQEGPLEAVTAKAQSLGLENVVPVRADLEKLGGTNIPSEALDVVLLANVLFQSQAKDKIIQEAHRALKQGGRLLIIDWAKGAGGPLPDEHRSEPGAMKELVTGQQFTFDKDVEAGPFFFGMEFTK
jgi:ubiquinone/menaquinone biosynthesis C-methylase UbiE